MKLTMMRGLPASGKTTKARGLVKDEGSSGRINRDDLRAMLFDSVWTGKREGIVVDCEKAIAAVLFKHGMNPIIDDTNLSARHWDMWRNVAKEAKQHFEVHVRVDTVEVCRERDAARDKPVGRPVIDRMAIANGMVEWGEKLIVLVDIDGTLASGEHREHFVTGPVRDWQSYYSLLDEDTPIDIVVRWVKTLALDHTICIVSGRPDTYQIGTIAWLNRYEIPFDFILMRSGGDKRPDTMIKNDMLKLFPKEKIAFAIDDRPSVIREVWRANGVRVFPVRGACEDF